MEPRLVAPAAPEPAPTPYRILGCSLGAQGLGEFFSSLFVQIQLAIALQFCLKNAVRRDGSNFDARDHLG